MADAKIRIKDKTSVTSVASTASFLIQDTDDADKQVPGSYVLQTKDTENNFTSSSITNPLSGAKGKELKELSDWQNRADGILFTFDSIWTITAAGSNLTITIPAGKYIDIDSGTSVSFTAQSAQSIDDGGGITATITGGSITYAFVADISSISESDDKTIFVIAKNVGGKLVSRNPSINSVLYEIAVTITDLSWLFDVSIVDADPGSGDFRMNNTDPSLVTEIYFSKTANNSGDVSDILLGIVGSIRITQSGDATKYIVGAVGTVSDNTGYVTIPVTITDNGLIFTSSSECITNIFEQQEENPSDITRNYLETSVSASAINLDFASKNEVWATDSNNEGIAVAEDITLNFSNITNAKTCYVDLNVTGATRIITIDSTVVCNDLRWEESTSNALDLEIGIYKLIIYFNDASKYLKILPEINNDYLNQTITFSAAPAIDVGRYDFTKMAVSGNTVPTLTNKKNGTVKIVKFAANATPGWSIDLSDSSFGTKTDNAIDDITSTTASATYTVTIIIDPDGDTEYTIESQGN